MSLPDEIWIQIAKRVNREYIFTMLQVSKRISMATLDSISLITDRWKYSSWQQLRNLRAIYTSRVDVLPIIPSLKITTLHISVYVHESIHVDLPNSLTDLYISGDIQVNPPLGLSKLTLINNYSSIDLSLYTALTYLYLEDAHSVSNYALTQLKSLSLVSGCYEKHMLTQNDISLMTHLQELSMYYVNGSASVLTMLQNLHSLSLFGYVVTKPLLPTNLKKLELMCSNIAELPASLCELNILSSNVGSVYNLTNLHSLSVEYEPPQGINVLTQLISLKLYMKKDDAKQQLLNLHRFTKLKSLTTSYVPNNITQLGLQLDTLHMTNECDLSDDILCKLTSLTRLQLHPSTTINGISTLTNLTELTLNKGTTILDFTLLLKLKYLVIPPLYVRTGDLLLPICIKHVTDILNGSGFPIQRSDTVCKVRML